MGNTATKVIVGAAIVGAGALIALSYSPNSDGDRRKEKEEAARNDGVDQKMKMKDKSAASQRKKKKKELQSFAPEVNGYPYQIPQRPKPSSSYIQQQGVVKIMSYNIWNLKERKIQERMKAISQLILQHCPDIILLQEVTPLVYKFFQTCDWWTTYQCSVKPEKADRQIFCMQEVTPLVYKFFKACNWWRTYQCSVQPEKATKKNFCMQLSKLHVKKFFCRSFKNATTGRGLYIAKIKAGPVNKKLIVATCHLKRPTDSDKCITERVTHATEALHFLHAESNVVFGGDMNWNEITDGPFPLLGDWCDAWSILRPAENGWTYDTTTNGMMRHSRLLKMRLDRFFCKLKDFKMVSIDRIGMKEIPGVMFEHNGKMLPVLPSDHYGLLLTICPKQGS